MHRRQYKFLEPVFILIFRKHRTFNWSQSISSNFVSKKKKYRRALKLTINFHSRIRSILNQFFNQIVQIYTCEPPPRLAAPAELIFQLRFWITNDCRATLLVCRAWYILSMRSRWINKRVAVWCLVIVFFCVSTAETWDIIMGRRCRRYKLFNVYVTR